MEPICRLHSVGEHHHLRNYVSRGGDDGAATVFMINTNGVGFAVLLAALTGSVMGPLRRQVWLCLVLSLRNCERRWRKNGGIAFTVSPALLITSEPPAIQTNRLPRLLTVAAIGASPLHYQSGEPMGHPGSNRFRMLPMQRSPLRTSLEPMLVVNCSVTNGYGSVTSSVAIATSHQYGW